MKKILTELSVSQDYGWFVSIILWGLAATLYFKNRKSLLPNELGWVPASAIALIGVGVVEWWLFSTPVKVMGPSIPPHRIGDIALGLLLAAQTIGWVLASRASLWLRGAAAVLFLIAALLRLDQPAFGSALIAAATILLVPLWWRRNSHKGEKVALGCSALIACGAPLDFMLGQQRAWMEVSQISAVISVVSAVGGLFAVYAIVSCISRRWDNAAGQVRMREIKRFGQWGLTWLVFGFVLCSISGANARFQFEQSVLTRAKVLATTLDLDRLADLLGPKMKLQQDSVVTYTRPSGKTTHYAHVPHHTTRESLPIREALRGMLKHDPDLVAAFIATLRDRNLVVCLAPHDPEKTPEADPQHFSFVTVQRAATERDVGDWAARRERFEVELNTTYNEVAIARVPLVHPTHGMLGWLEFDLPVSFWIVPQTRAHGQAILAVALGLGVLGSLGVQRWRSHQREMAQRDAEIERETNVMRSLFMAKVSHELRTPLQGILGYGEMLATTALESDQRRQLETIMSHGNMLSRLVNDLIDLSAIKAGTVRFNEEPVEFPAAIITAAESLRQTAESKGLQFEVRTDHTTPVWVWADAQRIRQVVTNLLANAIKFTAQGRVEISVTLTRQSDDIEVAIEVADTGPGIAAAEQAKLFRPFMRLARTEHCEGAGLGLVITTELCHRMRGSVTVSSDGKIGSRFRAVVLLPSAAPRQLAPSGVTPLFSGSRILVADDNSFIRELFVAYLSGLGASCQGVANGHLAVSHAAKERFDVIVLDLMMPGLDGLHAAQAIRANGASRQARIVAVSAHSGEDFHNPVFDCQIAKPVKLPDLGRALAPQELTTLPAANGLADLLAEFQKRFHVEAAEVRLRLRAAVQAHQWHELARVAHEAKNSADVLGDERLANALARLEQAAEVADESGSARAVADCDHHLAAWIR